MTSTTQQPAGTFLWKCPFCTREVRFPEGSEDYSAISAVHHFHEHHHITKEWILTYRPNFAEAVAEYFD